MEGRGEQKASSSGLASPLLSEQVSALNGALPSSSSSRGKGFLFFSSSSHPRFGWMDSELLVEIKRQLALAVPLVAVSLLQYLLQLISLMFAGHLGELPLAGASMASSFANVSGFSLLVYWNDCTLYDLLRPRNCCFWSHSGPRSISYLSLEYWSFEMVVLLSGLLPNPKLEASVLSISLNTMWMVYMIPSGLGNAVSIRLSNELGAGSSSAAHRSVQAVFIIVIVEGLMIALSTILIRDYWGYLFSYEDEVVRYVSAMIPILATSDFMDGVQCALSGAARGCGWQHICSVINLGAYYVVGIPSAILFAFVLHFGGKGLWLGIICGLIIQVLVLIIMNLHTDWDKEARKARDRLQSSDIVDTAYCNEKK